MKMPETAMVLAAGLGKRMRPITETIPKPLVKVAGKPLIDWGLDALEAVGVPNAVVNVHYLADQLDDYLADRAEPHIVISDERDLLLDSAGGIVKALPLLGTSPFYLLNADTFWVGDTAKPNLAALSEAWDDARMDILLMTAGLDQATGFEGKGDFVTDDAGRLRRARDVPGTPLIYAGAGIIHPRIFAGATPEVASLNRYFDKAIAEGRLYGMPMVGHWLTVGTPEAIAQAEAALSALV
ncbi:nucleotidyltransferase family protein [Ochrobactrum sp. RH2CCR150]|uniref:nucleotidyltransferase family protein n=1 Tax=Ochrobactrum sp. RH2CCR150 TaxID=2587044 RepID=UPI0015FC0332|nr:MurNAc alpha-1-phosphate uridylyltransferase [Ochrobactrum sp. RH2CCR150]URQ74830.1 MAG: nucleotidyltransferase family protein [Candidatus Ochrobactrum gambitense]WEK16374.1 MAG: nucleotidyltransferase family protein [Candidatus Ochrobactrum gambitense]